CLSLVAWSLLFPSVEPADVAEIDRLISQLGSQRFGEREAATKRLEVIGQRAAPALARAAITVRDPEVRRRLESIVDDGSMPLLERAIRFPRGSIKGRVVYEGEPPKRRDLKSIIEGSRDRDHLLKGDTRDPLWIVGPKRGVANVVVWLRPVEATHF